MSIEPGGPLELGELLSFTARIEPELLRAVRLHLAPRCAVGDEADFWFGDWIGFRGSEYVHLKVDAATTFRAGLAERLRAGPRGPARRAWDVVSRMHVHLSPALRLEEELAWTSVLVEAGLAADADLERVLEPALRAVVLEQRQGVADWFAAAFHRLPPAARATEAAWQLVQLNPRLRSYGTVASRRVELGHVATLVDRLGVALVWVRHSGSELHVSRTSTVDQSVAIEVPDTDPVILEAQWTVDGREHLETVTARRGEAEVRLAVGPGPVLLRTGRGDIYEVSSVAAVRGARPPAPAAPPLATAPSRIVRGDRVFMSHTSELASEPTARSYVDAVLAAVARARLAPVDIRYFSAAERSPTEFVDQVGSSAAYVGLVGFRYGSVPPGTDKSYVELEFDAATEAGLPRLMFLLRTEPDDTTLVDDDRRQIDRFRAKVQNAGLIVGFFDTPEQLELSVYLALSQLVDDRAVGWVWAGPEGADNVRRRVERLGGEPGGGAFQGRAAALAAVTGWLGSEHNQVLVVTGQPGAGKSTLIARALLDLQESTSDTQPGLAFHARGATLADLLAAVAAATGTGVAASIGGMIDRLGQLADPPLLRVVVDSLDEAAGSAEEDFATALVELADLPWTRVVVAAGAAQGPARFDRGALLHSLGVRASTAANLVDLDDARFFDRTGLQTMVAALLRQDGAEAGPPDAAWKVYRADPALCDRLAAGIANWATGNHRLATTAALQLSRADTTVDPLAPGFDPSMLAPLDPVEPPATRLDLAPLLRLGDPASLDTTVTWAARAKHDQLRVPIGIGPDGTVIELDLKESALEGMGPHGLVVGATGSGKSELLRTIVIALAVRHSPEEVNVVLIDVRGGATFHSLEQLPHTSAVVTNLLDDVTLIDRLRDGLQGEIMRRQELLRRAGNYTNREEYERARRAGAPLTPLPSLVIVCDEFSELLAARPEFLDIFIMIARVGRSLGVHLLLASWRLEPGRLRGLDTHLSYRVALHTFSAAESREIIGTSDAYELPHAPGHAYLKVGAKTLHRFLGAYVSSLIVDVLVERMRGLGTPAHQVWLPPLAEPSCLSDLLPRLAADDRYGLHPISWPQRGQLSVPIGVVDRPFEQRRDPLVLDFSGADLNVAIVGGPRSGKSTLVQSLICSLALAHTPWEVQFFCLDFGGGTLRGLADLPHVSGVATRLDTEAVRRTVAEVADIVEERQDRFARLGVEEMAAYRRRRREGEQRDDPFGDVFLVVDGWAALAAHDGTVAATVSTIAESGSAIGVHLVLTAIRWSEIRGLRELFGTRLELRLSEPEDSVIDPATAARVPAGSPGRGLTAGKMQFLGAVARIDGQRSAHDLAAATAQLVDRVRQAWTGRPAPRVRLLPRVLPMAQLLERADPELGLPIGLDEAKLAPVYLDVAADPHLIVLGDAQSGKTNVLRLIANEIVRRHTPNEARIIVGDLRRSLLGVVASEHLLEYAHTNAALDTAMSSVRDVMMRRLPGPDVTPEQLRTRSWWQGPELYVLIDDYDLFSTTAPLAAIRDLLPQGRDVGLHVIVARRAGGAARAMYEPVLQRLRELATPGLLLSGDPAEGPLLGNLAPSPQPPGRGHLVRRGDDVRLIQVAWDGSRD